jgi:hypothetical protein
MTNSRLLGIFAVFLFIAISGSLPANARDCLIGFPVPFPPGCNTGSANVNPIRPTALCVVRQPFNTRTSTITWFDCDRGTAEQKAREKAEFDAAGFARGTKGNNPCQGSSGICTALCASAGSSPLFGAAAANVRFDNLRQNGQGWPNNGIVQVVSQAAGLCESTVDRESQSFRGTGRKACGVFPGNWAPFKATTTADAYCGCMCL